MSDQDDARFDALIERSSLGTPGARQLRRRTSDSQLEAVRRMIDLRNLMVHSSGDESRLAAAELIVLMRQLGYKGQVARVLSEAFPGPEAEVVLRYAAALTDDDALLRMLGDHGSHGRGGESPAADQDGQARQRHRADHEVEELAAWLRHEPELAGRVRAVDRADRPTTIGRSETVNKRSRALILVATSRERDAVMTAVRAVNDTQPSRQFHPHHVVFGLGQVSQTEILLGQSEQGAIGVGASALTTSSLIKSVEPDYLILTGICFSLRDDQRLGDVLIASQLRVIDHKKLIDAPSESQPRAAAPDDPPVPPPVEIRRGDSVTPSVILLGGLVSAQVDWTGQPVHFGPMLSANTLVNSAALRQQLIRQEPDAIGGEMEGAGVYAAAAKEKVDWIMVKGISDAGVHKTDEAQSLAARNAAEFVIHTISTGALDPRSRP